MKNIYTINEVEKTLYNKNGYIVLSDLLLNNEFENLKKNIKDSIIIAPANYLAFTDYTLMHKLKSIIEILLESYDYKIIFRPHPQNRNNIIENNKIKDEVAYLNKFIDNENFEIDLSDNYLQKYLKSKLMISDLSGTAFTYSFITNCPVVFFSPNEKKYAIDYGNFEHFKIREKIGLICNNVENLKEKINFLISNKEEYEKKILNEKKKIENLNVSKKNIQKILLNL